MADSFSSLLDPTLSTNTTAFLSVYRDGIAQSTDPKSALTRFKVIGLSINKSNDLYQHEYISVNVWDDTTQQRHLFFIERQGGNAPPIPVEPESSFHSSTSTILFHSSTSTAEFHPLVDINDTSTLEKPSAPSAPGYSFRDFFSKVSVGGVHSSLSSHKGSFAEDRITGKGTFVNGEALARRMGRVELQLEPVDLYLYELGILADVVHNYAPNYSIVDKQCYWFVKTIFDVVSILYPKAHEAKPVDFLPNLAGRWRNLPILLPQNGVIEQVAVKFTQRQDEEFRKVKFF